MSKIDSLSSVLSSIQNGQRAKKSCVAAKWPSNLSVEVLKKLYKEGYIRGFSVCAREASTVLFLPPKGASTFGGHTRTEEAPRLNIFLKYSPEGAVIRNIRRISKSSKRVWFSPDAPKGGKIKLTSMGQQTFLSTSKGILTLNEALKRKIGGELLFEIECSVS